MIMVLKIKLHVCGNYVYIVQREVGGGISAYQNQIDKYTNSAKKQWKIINEVISNSKPKNKVSKLKLPDSTITDSKDIAEAFNSYFCSVAGKLKDEIPSSNHRFLPNFKHVHNSIFGIP